MTAGHERPREEWIEIPVPALVSEESFARAQEFLQESKVRSRRRTIEPSIVQGMVSYQRCGYAFSSTSTQTSARKIHCYKCIGSDSWRKLGGPVCDIGRLIRQDLRYQIVWAEASGYWKTPRSYRRNWTVGWQQRARLIRAKSASKLGILASYDLQGLL